MNLYVGNLPWSCSEEEIEALFAQTETSKQLESSPIAIQVAQKVLVLLK